MNDLVMAPNGGAKLSSLDAIEWARRRLEEASSFEDVLAIKDASAAAKAYLERKEKGSEAHAAAWALTQEADRRLGEFTRALPKARPGPKRKIAPEQEVILDAPPTKTEVMQSMGVKVGTVARAERLADVPRDEWDKRIEAGKARITAGRSVKDPGATTSASDYSSDEWCTPEKFIEAARRIFGGTIELDPASNAFGQNVVRAERWHHKTDSGLIVPWRAASVWLNPPYSRMLCSAFVEKCCTEHAAGNFDQGIVLTNSSTETGWYQNLIGSCSAICLPDERIAFELNGTPIADNRNAQTFFYLGDKLELFLREFSQFGKVLTPLRGFL